MAHGLQVWNADGRKMIDSTEVAPNTYLANLTTTSYSAMSYPPSGFTAGDLVMARPVNSPTLLGGTFVPIGIGRSVGSTQQFFGSQAIQTAGHTEWANTSGIKTGLIKTQSGNISGPAAGEYGLDVYAADNSTIMFSATRSTAVTILAQGSLTGGQSFTYTPPASLDYSKVYGVVNGTTVMNVPQSFLFPSWVFNVMYRFYTTASTPYITAQNIVTRGGSNISGWAGGRFAYMMVYDPN